MPKGSDWLTNLLKRSSRTVLDEQLSLNLSCKAHGDVTHWKCPKCVDDEIKKLKLENQQLSAELSIIESR